MTDFSTLTAAMDGAVFATLADSATINGAPCRGMFRAPWQQPDLGSLRTGLVEPSFVVRDADAAGIVAGARLERAGRAYDVIGIEPDSTGLTSLVLRERLA